MGKIRIEDIGCRELENAYWRAYGNAIDQKQYSGGVDLPATAGNSVSMKGQLNGISACVVCNRKVSVELHLKPIHGAIDRETEKPVKIFDGADPVVSANASGSTCIKA